MEPARPLRTFTLTERVAADCRLTPADVEFLLAEHGSHLELIPTGQRGRYRLTPAGHVGTIVGPSCRLLIRPKIPLQSLFHLLDPTTARATGEDRTTPEPGEDLLDFLASRLALLLEECAAAGLHRSYTERSGPGPFLQGRLDVAAQLRDPSGHKGQFHCHYEEFTADGPWNQVPKATAELVLRSSLLAEGPQQALRRALRGWDAVTSVVLRPESFAAALPDRLPGAYRPLLELCRLLAEGLTPGEEAGTAACPCFLLNMERVFESYVAQGVVGAFAGSEQWSVSVQPFYLANQPIAGQPDISLRPDLVVAHAGRPRLVVDTKWKRLAGSPLVTADLYQVLAYCTALGAPRAVLVYPGRRDRVWKYPLAQAPIQLDVRTLRVSGSREACRGSLQRLGLALRRSARQAAR